MKTHTMKKKLLAGVLALAVVAGTAAPGQVLYAADKESLLPAATNTSFASARELPFDTSIAEDMSRDDNVRYYKFSVSDASELIVRGKFKDGWATNHISVYDENKTEIVQIEVNDAFSDSIFVTGGNYYLKLEAGDKVSFTTTVNSLGESSVETQDNNNDTLSGAFPIELKKKYKGVLASNDDIDYYKFSTPSAGKVNFNITNATDGRLKYAIYDSSTNMAASDVVYSNQKGTQEIKLTAGSYYLAVTKADSNDGGVGSYNFNMDFIALSLKAPAIKNLKAYYYDGMQFSWNKISDADGYQIQYCKSLKFKSGVKKDIKSENDTYASYSGLSHRKKYYVRMRAYVNVQGTTKYSKWSKVKVVKIK